MMKKKADHSWGKGIIATARGYAMKASPGPADDTKQMQNIMIKTAKHRVVPLKYYAEVNVHKRLKGWKFKDVNS